MSNTDAMAAANSGQSWYKASKMVETIDDMDLRREAKRSIEPNDQLARQVKVFHRLYNLPVVRPSNARLDFSHITKHRLAMRFGLVVEEFMELCEAMDIRADINFYYLDEDSSWVKSRSVLEMQAWETHDKDHVFVDMIKDTDTGVWHSELTHNNITDEQLHVIVRERLQEAILETDERDIVEVADACGDLKYVIQGFEYEVGIPGPAVLAEIQRSNLSKLGANGQPIYREDGKVLKGPDYFKPDVLGVLKAYGLRIGKAADTRI